MKKTLIGVLVFVALCVVCYFVFLRENDDNNPEGSYTDFPVVTPGGDNVKPNESTILLSTSAGNVAVNAIQNIPNARSIGGGNFVLVGNEPEVEQPFDVVFYDTDSSFVISLNQEPIAETRVNAEQYMLRILGISEIDLCKLNSYVSVTYLVNPVLSGKNLGFSFCPGSVPLE